MEVLITGVTGRVGRNLSKLLIDNGHSVRGLVLENDKNIELVKEIGVKCYKGNLNNPDSLIEAVLDVNAIYHLGGLMSWGNDDDNPLLFDDNLKGTFNLLNAVLSNKVNLAKFIFASSDEVYPSLLAKELPIKETHPTTPYSFYGLTKLACEQMVLYFQRANNIPATIARFALVTEPEEVTHKTGWLGRFLFFEPMFNIINSIAGPDAAKELEKYRSEKEQLILARDISGNPYTFHYCDVRDLTECLLLMLENTECIGNVFNISGPEPFKYDKAVPYLSKKLDIPYIDVKIDGPSINIEHSIEKARTVLCYDPKYDIFKTIDDGVKKISD